MKCIIINIMATTGLAVVVLAAFVRTKDFDLYFSYAVLPIFAANIVINLGLILTRKFESKYVVLEVLLDMAYTSAVLIIFGIIFDWFGATPVIVLVAMAAAIHLIAIFLNMAHVRGESNEINKLLKKRDKKRGMRKKEIKG